MEVSNLFHFQSSHTVCSNWYRDLYHHCLKIRPAEMKTLKMYVFYYKVGVLLQTGSSLVSEQT